MKEDIIDISPAERIILSKLKFRPALILGKTSLTNFWHWSNGYDFAMKISKNSQTHNLLPNGLNEFTAEYLKTELSARCCFSLILEREHDETKALYLFFEILDKYLLYLNYEPIPVWNDKMTFPIVS